MVDTREEGHVYVLDRKEIRVSPEQRVLVQMLGYT